MYYEQKSAISEPMETGSLTVDLNGPRGKTLECITLVTVGGRERDKFGVPTANFN
jgi:hypothetical protein